MRSKSTGNRTQLTSDHRYRPSRLPPSIDVSGLNTVHLGRKRCDGLTSTYSDHNQNAWTIPSCYSFRHHVQSDKTSPSRPHLEETRVVLEFPA